MKKILLLIVMLLSAAASAFAEEVEINGLRYDVNTVTKEATVILYKNNDNKYKDNIVIPETVLYRGVTCSVTSIGDYAFYYCTGLTSVTIGNSVTSIGSCAFYHCAGLTSVTIGNSVTSIGDEAFCQCYDLTSVTIPNSVTSMGSGAFRDCNGLQKVIVKDIAAWCGISFSDIHSNPLLCAKHLYCDENTEITELIIPNSVTSIGDYAFCQCTDLTSVTIPNSVTSIGSSAFRACTGLTSVTIGNSVTSIGNLAFGDCVGLTSVTIPNSVTSIGDEAFDYCIGLTSVTIGNSVTSIGYEAFSCTGLTSVTIPNSVTSIGNGAFYHCSGLTSVTCYAENVPSTGSNAFDSSNMGNATLYVPTASIDAYKTTEPWSGFKVIEGIETGIKDIKTNATSSSPIYDLHGRRVEKTTKGLYIVNGNKVMMK